MAEANLQRINGPICVWVFLENKSEKVGRQVLFQNWKCVETQSKQK